MAICAECSHGYADELDACPQCGRTERRLPREGHRYATFHVSMLWLNLVLTLTAALGGLIYIFSEVVFSQNFWLATLLVPLVFTLGYGQVLLWGMAIRHYQRRS